MRFVRNLLRIYSYIFEAILCLMALGMAVLVLASPHQEVRLGWLPWPQESLGKWLLGLGMLGMALVILAAVGRIRFLLTLFALTALVILARGLFFSSWRFSGPGELRNALWLVGGSLLAFLGSIPMRAHGNMSGYRGSRGR